MIAEAERLYLVNIYRAQQLASSLATTATVLSLMDGLVMGSGTMFGLNSSHSLATERTVWALPEVASCKLRLIVHVHCIRDLSAGEYWWDA